MAVIQIGIIGTGWVAGAHAAALSKIEGVKVVAACSTTPGRARTALDDWGLPEAKSYDGRDAMLLAVHDAGGHHQCLF